jgi:hypothetical protein
MPKKAKARMVIDNLLRRSRWRFFDDQDDPANMTPQSHGELNKQSSANCATRAASKKEVTRNGEACRSLDLGGR